MTREHVPLDWVQTAEGTLASAQASSTSANHLTEKEDVMPDKTDSGSGRDQHQRFCRSIGDHDKIAGAPSAAALTKRYAP